MKCYKWIKLLFKTLKNWKKITRPCTNLHIGIKMHSYVNAFSINFLQYILMIIHSVWMQARYSWLFFPVPVNSLCLQLAWYNVSSTQELKQLAPQPLSDYSSLSKQTKHKLLLWSFITNWLAESLITSSDSVRQQYTNRGSKTPEGVFWGDRNAVYLDRGFRLSGICICHQMVQFRLAFH